MGTPASDPSYCAPTSAIAGETLVWLVAASDTPPADGWACTVTLTNGAGTTSTVTATAEGSTAAFRVTLPAATTTALAEGTARWVAMATKGGEAYPLGSGTIVVTPLGGLSQAERDLAAIDAVIRGRWTADLQSYQVAGKQIVKMEPRELRLLRNRIAQRVRTARHGTPVVTHLVTF